MNIFAPEMGALQRAAKYKMGIFSETGQTVLVKLEYFMETASQNKTECVVSSEK
jgi:hypothetical protein